MANHGDIPLGGRGFQRSKTMTTFIQPDFSARDLEFRFEEGEVLVYGSQRGLTRLAEICLQIAQQLAGEDNAHVHLEDHDLLTDKSLRAVVAGFQRMGTGEGGP
jgi:hypothetical protein